ATKGPSSLISFQGISSWRKEITSVEGCIAHIPEGRPVPVVGARSGNHVNYTSGGIGILGTEVVDLDAEFLYHVWIRKAATVVAVGVGVVATVQGVVNTSPAGTANRVGNSFTAGVGDPDCG